MRHHNVDYTAIQRQHPLQTEHNVSLDYQGGDTQCVVTEEQIHSTPDSEHKQANR